MLFLRWLTLPAFLLMVLLHLETDFTTAIVRRSIVMVGRKNAHGSLDESMQHARLRETTSKL